MQKIKALIQKRVLLVMEQDRTFQLNSFAHGMICLPADGSMDARMQMQMQMQSKKEYVAKQQRWLLFLRHCAKCQAAEGQCTYGQSCTVAKQLWRHILTCADPNCEYPRYAVIPSLYLCILCNKDL